MSAMGRNPPSRLPRKTTLVQRRGQEQEDSTSPRRPIKAIKAPSERCKSCRVGIASKPHPDLLGNVRMHALNSSRLRSESSGPRSASQAMESDRTPPSTTQSTQPQANPSPRP
eukprot:6970759-Pyramimonas_sp.AAC.1